MARVLFAVAATLALSSAGALADAPAPARPSAQQAEDAYFQMDVSGAERLFTAVLGDPHSDPAELARAGRGLARIDWLIDRDAAKAEAALDRAVASGRDLCSTEVMYARVLRESGNAAAASTRASAHGSDCPGAQKDRLLLESAKADADQAAPARGPQRSAALARAAASLAGLSSYGLPSPDAQRLKLELSLARSDAAGALDAWRGYFWLSDRNAPESFGVSDAEAAADFTGALGPHPSLSHEISLERLLVRGGFLTAARRFDQARQLSVRAARASAYRPVAVYFDFRRRLDAATLAFDRAHARGQGDPRAYEAQVEALIADAARRLGGGEPAATLGRTLGLRWSLGNTGGVMSLHMGHVVEDRRYRVVQFGRSGEIEFVSIDNMASNGYQSWLWDGLAATGGWSEGTGAIVQVRSGYTPAALRALASLDPANAQRNAEQLAQAEKRDAEALREMRIAYLPGLQMRLGREALQQIAAKARAEAARTSEPFERLFLKDFWDAEVGHSIFIHEGRHALDHIEFQGDRSLKGAELEYRAKLSELELAEFPKLALAAILASNIGDETDHGQANARVMQGLVDWVEANPSAVAGFDPTLATASELDKLSDDQLRAIAKGLDPYFKEHPDQR
jgi:hypothetical protein